MPSSTRRLSSRRVRRAIDEPSADRLPPPRTHQASARSRWQRLVPISHVKGLEWDAVFVLNLVDGCIPSDTETGTDRRSAAALRGDDARPCAPPSRVAAALLSRATASARSSLRPRALARPDSCRTGILGLFTRSRSSNSLRPEIHATPPPPGRYRRPVVRDMALSLEGQSRKAPSLTHGGPRVRILLAPPASPPHQMNSAGAGERAGRQR
jgi:hypothetical protein